MDSAANVGTKTIELEFARTIKYMDIYMQQKTDLFLQHYVLEPVNFLFRQIMFLPVIVTLLAAGTGILVMGVILFIAIFVPFWLDLLITGFIQFGTGILIANALLSDKIILNTTGATEMKMYENPQEYYRRRSPCHGSADCPVIRSAEKVCYSGSILGNPFNWSDIM
ncbi:MAG: hypothetical protein WCF90_04090 [Methanomicrobiales archaeon]